MEETIQFRLNGRPVRLSVDTNRMLLWVLRTDLGLTGTKYGCGQNHCGACTVLVDNDAVRSCTVPVKEIRNRQVTTIEGILDGNLHGLQKAFLEQNAYQCGFCTPGMILTAYALLVKKPNPARPEIIAAMDGNLCRCGSYSRIVRAIEAAARATKGVA